MKIFMLFAIFLLIGAFFIISEEKIKINKKENINIFFEKYSEWLDQLVKNGKAASSYAIKMEWLPEN